MEGHKREYIAQTGEGAKDRLSLQHQVFSPGTEALLKIAKFRPDMRILIVGCGCGDETIMVAKLLNDTGSIVAIDSSAEQIHQAKAAVKAAGHEAKLSFITKSVYELDPSDGKFDLILCRFVIPHLIDPKAAIEILKTRLHPGGMIASQEPIVSTCRTEPQSSALESYLNLMLAFSAKIGRDFDMAKSIPALFESCGLTTVSQTWQPEVFGEDKRMVIMSAVECMPAIQSAGLIIQEVADSLIANLETEVMKKSTRLFQCINILTVGENPPAISLTHL
ncbi:MAG: methyltransferase domain-containing protein [Gammaproteobacteria bacterium]|nr:methyltransferase domain-containing protein [Gammaproteobacteria bacterium]